MGEAAKPHACDICHTVTEPFALYEIVEGDPSKGWQCGSCIADQTRLAVSKWEVESKLPRSSWDSEYGQALKAERNRRLDANRWAIMADTPLSLACQGKFIVYLKLLQNMTLDFPTTTGWTWPTVPKLEYPPRVSASISASVSVAK